MKTVSRLGLHTLALVLATALITSGPAWAEDPENAPRLFADLTFEGIDWEADASRRIVAHRAGNTAHVIEFGTPDHISFFLSDFAIQDADGNVVLDLAGTTWVQVPVLHITDSGAEHLTKMYWLVESDSPPDTGLTTSTGPNGKVLPFAACQITRIASGNGDNSEKFRIVGNGEPFRVSLGVFNK